MCPIQNQLNLTSYFLQLLRQFLTLIYLFIFYSVYQTSKSLMTKRHCFWHADLVIYIFPQTTVFLRNLIISPIHNSFSVVPLCYPGYCISFCCPCLVDNVLLLVFGFCMLHICKLVVHFLTSNVRGLV